MTRNGWEAIWLAITGQFWLLSKSSPIVGGTLDERSDVMPLRITSQRRNRVTARAVRMPEESHEQTLPMLTAMLVLSGLLATLLLLTTP